MDHLAQRNSSDYYHQSQSDMTHNVNKIYTRSSVNITSNGITTTSNVTSRPRPNTEVWKKSSTDKTTNTKIETWKMSGKPRHAQLQHIQDDSRLKRQSTPLFNSPYHHPKPLPQEPSPIIQNEPFNLVYPIDDHYSTQQPFHLTTPVQHMSNYNEVYSPPLNQVYPPNNDFVPLQQPLIEHQHYTSQSYNEYPPSQLTYNEYPPSQPYNEFPPSQSYNEYPPLQQTYSEYPPTQIYNPTIQDKPNYPPVPIESPPSQHTIKPVPKTDEKSKKKKDAKPEKKVRQITVQSINIEHRVWIDVLPAETGLSLAEKIHIIATFRTRKIVSITTASGRKIPLDNRPVFGSWMDMEKFEDGERWTVEWKENDRGVVDRFMSKIVQSKRKD